MPVRCVPAPASAPTANSRVHIHVLQLLFLREMKEDRDRAPGMGTCLSRPLWLAPEALLAPPWDEIDLTINTHARSRFFPSLFLSLPLRCRALDARIPLSSHALRVPTKERSDRTRSFSRS